MNIYTNSLSSAWRTTPLYQQSSKITGSYDSASDPTKKNNLDSVQISSESMDMLSATDSDEETSFSVDDMKELLSRLKSDLTSDDSISSDASGDPLTSLKETLSSLDIDSASEEELQEVTEQALATFSPPPMPPVGMGQMGMEEGDDQMSMNGMGGRMPRFGMFIPMTAPADTSPLTDNSNAEINANSEAAANSSEDNDNDI